MTGRGLLLLFLLLVLAGCEEEPFEPIEGNELVFSVYGFLDASADTQWVRVTSVRHSLLGSPDPPATVTLEHLGTGEVTPLRDSLFVYSSLTDVDGELYARNFWTDVPMEPGATYRLTATRSDGVSATTTALIPQDADTIVVGTVQGTPVFSGDNVQFGDYVRTVGAEYLAFLDVVPTLPSCPVPGSTHQGGGLDPVADENGDIVIPVFRIPRCAQPAEAPIRRWQIVLAITGAAWPWDPGWTGETTFLPDATSGVERGVGFLGGVLTRTVPYETCYIIGATFGDYCELAYTGRTTAVEGVVREQVQAQNGCTSVPSGGATVFLWENDGPDVTRSVQVGDIHGASIFLRRPDGVKVRTAYTRPDGSFRIDALAPGVEYGVAVSVRGVVHHETDGLAVESDQTSARDIEVPSECS